MNNEQLTSAARTVVELSRYFEDLKDQALEIYNPQEVAARGYITPSREIQLRHLQLLAPYRYPILYIIVLEFHGRF